MSGLRSLLQSRKFWLAVVGLAGLIASEVFGLQIDTEAVAGAIIILVGLIFSIAYEDGRRATPPPQ